MEYLCLGLFALVWAALTWLMLASSWRVFEKAGRAGWESLVPLYNGYLLTCEVARKEALWFVLLLVPLANVVAAAVVSLAVARRFGRSEGFGIGLLLLPWVFYPILGFGEARYGVRSDDRGGEGDDEEDDRPRSRNRPRDEDEDDRPRRRRLRDEDDRDEDDEDDRPRRRPVRDR